MVRSYPRFIAWYPRPDYRSPLWGARGVSPLGVRMTVVLLLVAFAAASLLYWSFLGRTRGDRNARLAAPRAHAPRVSRGVASQPGALEAVVAAGQAKPAQLEPTGFVAAPLSVEMPTAPLLRSDGSGLSPQMTSRVLAQMRARRNILDALSRPFLDPRELSELASAEPALVGEILKTVNSPAYGFRTPTASIHRAVLLLGHVEVRNIVWRTCLSQSVQPGLPDYVRSVEEEIWQHCFGVSRTAYALAKALEVPAPDELATAALLHDVGKLLTLRTRPDQALSLYSPVCFSAYDRLQAEIAGLGSGHAEFGGLVAEAWGLTPEMRRMIASHHLPSYMTPEAVSGPAVGIAVVHLADVLVHGFRVPAVSPEADRGPVYHPRDGWLKLLHVESLAQAAGLDLVTRSLVLSARATGQKTGDPESSLSEPRHGGTRHAA
jgi:putative nucleotidyltransferase with HDIG domain